MSGINEYAAGGSSGGMNGAARSKQGCCYADNYLLNCETLSWYTFSILFASVQRLR